MTKTKTLTLILASAALTAAIGLPAWSALHQDGGLLAAVAPGTEASSDQSGGMTIIAESDDQENEGAATIRSSGSGEHEGACEEDEGNCGSAATAPAAGTAPPPQNGLFGSDAPAQVQIK